MNASRISIQLHRLDRILGQWSEDEIRQMVGTEARGIALLKKMRQTLIQRSDTSCSDRRLIHVDRAGNWQALEAAHAHPVRGGTPGTRSTPS